MLIKTIDYIIMYVGVFIAVIVQAIFLMLPINLKNWEDDYLYVLTYIGLQGVSAGILFILVPFFLEIRSLQTNTLCFVIIGVCVIAALRAIKIIPLEFTFPATAPVIPAPKILFTDFHNQQRYSNLSDFSFEEADGELRYNQFRERLLKTRAEDNETILEELIGMENNMLD
ncbi:hypothetical protein QEJ31_10845 [Pigmentibacter sp. JX0631]|uniref:hypothetical protein n=1 Tax=Pigmentibacter sp. JX0631 TaxID=2976982 RepID=UPI002469C2C0|nr:hypothetical protein [Pigmentibacter sp. JX0631]WGL59017.1 hypothetical protein QEJ31_10845 [Pigmentibacter sp. JX0631]